MTGIGCNAYRTRLGRPARRLISCWGGSKTCFVLSVLVYLALPIPCDACFICVPPRVGDSWTYRKTTVMYEEEETRIETFTVSVIGTEQVGDQEYYRLGNGRLYRASADGVIWWYYGEGEVIYSDLWRVGAYQEGTLRYEGVLCQTPANSESFSEYGVKFELVRRGPLGMVVGDSLYSGVFEFWIEEEGARYCCSEFYLTLYVHPDIGAVKMTIDAMEYYSVWELIDFSRQSSESNVPSVVREVTWGTVKKRHMPERPR